MFYINKYHEENVLSEKENLRDKQKLTLMPTYFDRQPADQRRTKYSRPKNTTRTISIQKSVEFAILAYCLIVERTLLCRQASGQR